MSGRRGRPRALSPQQEQLVIYLLRLGLGSIRIARDHLNGAVSYRTVLRYRNGKVNNFVQKLDKNRDSSCSECGGRVELRGGEYVCLQCGLVDEERTRLEAQQARDIGFEVETHRPGLKLNFNDGMGSALSKRDLYRIVGPRIRQVTGYLEDRPKLRRLRNECSRILKNLGLDGDRILGDVVGRVLIHFWKSFQPWLKIVSLRYTPVAEGVVYLVLKAYKPRLAERLPLPKPDDAVLTLLKRHGVPKALAHILS